MTPAQSAERNRMDFKSYFEDVAKFDRHMSPMWGDVLELQDKANREDTTRSYLKEVLKELDEIAAGAIKMRMQTEKLLQRLDNVD